MSGAAQETTYPDYLAMSDDEIANMVEPELGPEAFDQPDEDTDVEPEEDQGAIKVEAEDDSSEEETEEDVESEDETTEESEAKDTDKDTTEAKEPEVELDYKFEYQKILAPFKANGREIQVKSVDEAISLMQMGANYHKKMAGLKPNLKLLKMLENNDLLDEQKLSFLVDLDKKNPEAIHKLIKDSGIDPLDMDTSKESEYRPGTYTVTDREVDLDAVLDEIQSTPTFNQTIDVVSNKWDGASKQTLAQHPQLLKVINDHMASGIYELISKEMETERLFGRLEGLSDIDAYKKVGDAIQERGGFNHLGHTTQEKQPIAVKPVIPKSKVEDPDLKSKKRAASTTKSAKSTKLSPDFNPLALSDEEFEKFANTNLM